MRLAIAAAILALSAAPAAAQPAGGSAASAPPEAPVFVEQTGRSHDAPPSARDLAYDNRLRASFASAQAFQGPLDGDWTVATGDGGRLYGLKLVDRGDGVVEGAWRDHRKVGALTGSGFVDQIQREGATLTLRFGDAAATFTGGYGDAWAGELEEAGARRRVTLRKDPR